jgi:hypothetical protein
MWRRKRMQDGKMRWVGKTAFGGATEPMAREGTLFNADVFLSDSMFLTGL